jgi:hypothetical protein
MSIIKSLYQLRVFTTEVTTKFGVMKIEIAWQAINTIENNRLSRVDPCQLRAKMQSRQNISFDKSKIETVQ